MAHYRLSGLDLSTRLALAARMLDPDRPWGEVTDLARDHHVSRKFLYGLQHRAEHALRVALAAQSPGPRPASSTLEVGSAFVKRAITVLTLLPPSLRGIQLGLELLFDRHCALGLISQTLQTVGEAATASNLSLPLPGSLLGEADEIFQGRQPCLTVVDGRSFLVLSLAPQERRDATTWGVTFLDLAARGARFHNLACDGARGIRAGVREAGLAAPLCPDRFHLVREGYRLTRRLETQAYRAIEVAERARRAEQEVLAPRRRRGPRLKVKVERNQAEREEAQAMAHADLGAWLFQEVRQALELCDPDGYLMTSGQARQTLQTASELLKALNHPASTAFAETLHDHLDELLAPLIWLEQTLAPWQTGLDAKTQALIVWAWKYHQALGVTLDQDFPEPLRATAQAFWEALALFHCSSSLAEALHSWLRPYLQIHRGMPTWLLPLLQLFWNHHPFQRGKRRGNSPLALAGIEHVPSLTQMLDSLLNPAISAQATA